MATKDRLSLHQWWQQVATPMAKLIVKEAGTNWPYFKAMAYGDTRITPEMMERIEAACDKFTPGIKPDYELCTRPSINAALVEAKQADKAAGIKRGRLIVGTAATGKQKSRPVRRSPNVIPPEA